MMKPREPRSLPTSSLTTSSWEHLPAPSHLPQAMQAATFLPARDTSSALTPFSSSTRPASWSSGMVLPSLRGLPERSSTFFIRYFRFSWPPRGGSPHQPVEALRLDAQAGVGGLYAASNAAGIFAPRGPKPVQSVDDHRQIAGELIAQRYELRALGRIRGEQWE